MTPDHSLKTTRSSHSAQYRRHWTYSDALKNSFFPPNYSTFGIVCLLLWQIPSPQRSLGHSLFKQKFSQKFLCFFLVVLFFCVVFVFYFIKISKFALPGVMLMYERTSIDRKKERKGYLALGKYLIFFKLGRTVIMGHITIINVIVYSL